MPLDDRYDVIRELGKGGMGVVFLARDRRLKREVAIKTVLRPEGEDESLWRTSVQRLLREAQAAASLEHKNIVAIHDVITDEASPWIVMQYVRGETLDKAVLPADPSLVTQVLKQVADALDHAHSRGVIHRDIKPTNIMMAESGGVLVMDFGIAKLVDSGTDLTRGGLIGSFEWMSPEQLNLEPLGGSSDQFSLAAVAYKLLTGFRAFQGDSLVKLCYQISMEEPQPASQRNSALPPEVDGVLRRALSKKPSGRFGSCTAFIAELDRALHCGRAASFPPNAASLDETMSMPLAESPGPRGGVRPEAGAIKLNGKDGQKYVWIPPGTFMMGASPDDEECGGDEFPAHEITITAGFWIGQTPVTVGAFKRYARSTGKPMPPEEDFLGRKVNGATGDDNLNCWTCSLVYLSKTGVCCCKAAGDVASAVPAIAVFACISSPFLVC